MNLALTEPQTPTRIDKHSPLLGSQLRPGGGLRRADGRRRIYCDSEDGISIERDFSASNELFGDVLQVRSNPPGHDVFSFDPFSYQYCLFVDGEPVGSLTSTAEVDGVMDCRDMYPHRLLAAHRDTVFSPCKFNISRNRFSSFRLMRLMVREYWRDQLRLGGRLAVMNARVGLIPFYQRMGFLVIEGSDFEHPHCGTQSVSLVLPADPSLNTFFSDLFDAIADPMSINEVRRHCQVSKQPARRQLATQS